MQIGFTSFQPKRGCRLTRTPPTTCTVLPPIADSTQLDTHDFRQTPLLKNRLENARKPLFFKVQTSLAPNPYGVLPSSRPSQLARHYTCRNPLFIGVFLAVTRFRRAHAHLRGRPIRAILFASFTPPALRPLPSCEAASGWCAATERTSSLAELHPRTQNGTRIANDTRKRVDYGRRAS